jgi:hypothetical protein
VPCNTEGIRGNNNEKKQQKNQLKDSAHPGTMRRHKLRWRRGAQEGGKPRESVEERDFAKTRVREKSLQHNSRGTRLFMQLIVTRSLWKRTVRSTRSGAPARSRRRVVASTPAAPREPSLCCKMLVHYMGGRLECRAMSSLVH